jgi:zinc transporter ZupT
MPRSGPVQTLGYMISAFIVLIAATMVLAFTAGALVWTGIYLIALALRTLGLTP